MLEKNLEREIVTLLEGYCRPSVVAGLKEDLKRGDELDRKVNGNGKKNQKKGISDRPGIKFERLDKIITFCEKTLSGQDASYYLLDVGNKFRDSGDWVKADEFYSMAIHKGESLADKSILGEAYLHRGELYSRKGQWKTASLDLVRARKIFDGSGDSTSLAKIENVLGTNCAEQGKLKEAKSHFNKALATFEKCDANLMSGMALMNIGIVQNIIGQFDLALSHFQRARSYFEMTGDLNRLALLHHNLGMTYLSVGQHKKAIAEFDVTIELCDKESNLPLLSIATMCKANAFVCLKDYTIALRMVNHVFNEFPIQYDRLTVAEGYRIKGIIFRELKRFRIADLFLKTSLRVNQELNNRLNSGETLYELGLLKLMTKNRSEAKSVFREALDCFEGVGARRAAEQTKDQLRQLGLKDL